jgi:pimeloyl-ACP methyl ester carboxylesterase
VLGGRKIPEIIDWAQIQACQRTGCAGELECGSWLLSYRQSRLRASWHEDFREDLSKIDVPALVLHGDADRILPITAAGPPTAKLIKGACLLVVKDEPHCITWTHAEEVNAELVNFLGKAAAKRTV